MDIITCFVAIIIMVYGTWWILKWFFKLGSRNSKSSEPLTPADLKVLEDTTKRLMDDLKIVTQECVERIECACQEAEKRIIAAKESGTSESSVVLNNIAGEEIQNIKVSISEPVIHTPLIESGAQTVAEFAKSTGMTTGEVELMRGLRKYNKNKES